MKDILALIPALLIIALAIAGIIGWIMNIISIFGADTFGLLELARCIGVVMAPLGAVLGYL